MATEPVWTLCRRERNFFAVLGNESGLFGHPTRKLITIPTPLFRLITDLKDHRAGYPRTVVLGTISPHMKVVKPRTKMVG